VRGPVTTARPGTCINRAGKNLPKARLHVLERAKGELRNAFGRD
jgi:Protein of unknown function (DUF3175)